MTKKLIVLDLDGTILESHDAIHPYTKQVIQAVAALGHPCILATGRPWRATSPFYKELGLTTPVINYNGALIHHPSDPSFPKKLLELSREFVLQMEDECGEFVDNIMCEDEDTVYLQKEDQIINQFFWRETAIVQQGAMRDILHVEPTTLIVKVKEIEDHSKFATFMAKHPDLIYRFWGGKYDLFAEVYSPEVDKSHAIRYVNDALYHIPEHHFIIFGDANNDLGMLRLGGITVAMLNGTDEAKKSAVMISKLPNTEGGVGHCLSRLFPEIAISK